MKAIYIYNRSSGKGKCFKKRDYIISTLKKCFSEFDIVESTSAEHFNEVCKNSCGKYDCLIFAGGDGSFNMAINAISEQKKRPILGVIPTGTVNDAAKNFGINKNIKKALKIIKTQHVNDFDVGKINSSYFVFTAATGVYADIPWATDKKVKERIGSFAYYFKALPSIFKKRNIKGKLYIDKTNEIEFKTPFLLIMNSTHIGGFKINPDSNINDGKFDLFITSPGPFNSLLYFLFPFLKKRKVKHYFFSTLHVELENGDFWDIDGEKGPYGNVDIELLKSHCKIFSKP